MMRRREVLGGVAAGTMIGMPKLTHARQVTKQILAFYYGWYGTQEGSGQWQHWAGSAYAPTTDRPSWGHYDSHDVRIVERQVELAQAAGLTGFISSWMGPGTFTDQSLAVLLKVAETRGFAVTAYIENAANGYADAVAALTHLAKNYSRSDSWLKAPDGRPCVFLYTRVLSQLAPDQWRAAADEVGDKTGVRFFLNGDTSLRNKPLFATRRAAMDGLHTYSLCPILTGKSPAQVRALLRDGAPHWIEMSGDRSFSLTLTPGYNDTLVPGRPRPRPVVDRHGGRTYEAQWEAALQNPTPWILISTWNEWHEGSEIEPSVEYGDAYIQLTRHWAEKYRAQIRA